MCSCRSVQDTLAFLCPHAPDGCDLVVSVASCRLVDLLLLLLLLLACPVGSGVLVTVLAVGARLQPLQRHERGGLLSCDAVVVVTCDV